MTEGVVRKGGHKGRKIDRNRLWCVSYRARNQREKNKAVRLVKYLTHNPYDDVAGNALHKCKSIGIKIEGYGLLLNWIEYKKVNRNG